MGINMSENSHFSEACERFRGDLVELALGTIDGRERARLVGHLASCVSCSAELDSLASLTDAMLLLAPEVEPPIGFESRVIERHLNATRVATSRRLPLMAAAAVVLVAAISFAIGSFVATTNGTTHPRSYGSPVMATLTSQDHTVGEVFVTSGHSPWIYMSIDDDNWTGSAQCRVIFDNGTTSIVGQFAMAHGYGAWAAKISAANGKVRGAQVLDARGRVLASATLS